MKANEIDLIGGELQKADQMKNDVPASVGMLSIKSANKTITDAKQRPDPIPLWLSLWNQGEISCLFSDSNLGKSIYAVQIADHIAKDRKVLYFDFELSDKQFQLRYTDNATGRVHVFPENLYRVELDPEMMAISGNFEDAIMENIEAAAKETNAKVLIIDNLTYLCSAAEKGDIAGSLMIRLKKMQKADRDLSMLIVAHTPKRPLSNPITQNDLAGSKKLYNFFDSVFAIGQSAKDSNLRYIKQIKVRAGRYEYDSENVIICSIEKENGAFLKFVQIGCGREREHLSEPSDRDQGIMIEQILTMTRSGESQRKIASQLGISQAKVCRILKSAGISAPDPQLSIM